MNNRSATKKSMLAFCGGRPLRTASYPVWPVWDAREERAVLNVLRSGRWGHTMRPDDQARRFEQEFAAYHGVAYAISVANGSVALEMALRTLKIGYGDEVIVTPTTWAATALAPVMVGADPVFVDIDPDTYCLDARRIKAAITRRTKAVILVHVGGYVADMDAILKVARAHRLFVIEDCAQAHGSMYHGRPVGSIGDFGCFSFEHSKLMTAGEGGAIITNDAALGQYAFSLCNARYAYGNKGFYFPEGGRMLAWNVRLTEFQAAILRIQLKRLDAQKHRRQAMAACLSDRLAGIPGIRALRLAPDQNHYSFLFKYDASCFNGVPVDVFRRALAAEGLPVFSSPSHQPPTYRFNAFYSPRRTYRDVRCPEAEKAFTQEAVGLQGRVLLGTRRDMDDIVRMIQKIKTHSAELRQWKG